MIMPLCTVLAMLAVPSLEQDSSFRPISPCPSVFTYDLSGSVPGRWSGVIHLSTDSTLHALWLNIVLDNKADILGNWVGDVTTVDKKNYKIQNTDVQIDPGPALPVHIFVNYNPFSVTPKLQAIRFNGREICNANTQQDVNQPDIEKSGRSDTQNQNPNVKFDSKKEPNLKVMLESKKEPVNEPSKESPNRIFLGPNNSQQVLKIESHDSWIPEQDISNSDHPGLSQCGKVVLNAVPLVVNGTPTLEGQWPWQIALYQTIYESVDGFFAYKCGGTLVSHKHVITAAHCVTEKQSLRLVDHNTLTVYLGKHNLGISDDKMQIRLVGKITVHPEYNPSPHKRDVAILELRDDVSYSDWVRPACLWPDDDIDIKNIIGKKGSVVGWGFDDTGKPTEELNLVEMPVVSQEACLDSYKEFFSRFISNYTYCAGYRDGTSVCNGDSGGGMVFNMNGIWYLRGLVSLSVLAPDKMSCDPSHYIIFTDLAKYLPWIYENVFDF